MNKYGLQTVMKLASCYGLKSSAQGSGKKQFVVVSQPCALAQCRDTVSLLFSVLLQGKTESSSDLQGLGLSSNLYCCQQQFNSVSDNSVLYNGRTGSAQLRVGAMNTKTVDVIILAASDCLSQQRWNVF